MKEEPLKCQNHHELKSPTLGPFLPHEKDTNVMNVKAFLLINILLIRT